MDRNIKRIGLVNIIALLVVGSAFALMSLYANSSTGLAGTVFLALGFLAAAVSYFQMRLEEREALEAMELQELRRSPTGPALFSQEADTFPARRSREQFEKYFLPGFTILLLALQAAATYWLWRQWGKITPLIQDRATITMALCMMFALVFFLLGKYSGGLARFENQRLLRPASSNLLLGALLSVLVAAGEVFAWFGFIQVDGYLTRILTLVLGLAAIETLVNLVFEIYRPRLRGQAVRLLYESRLIGLLSQPGGLITTAAQALDYQFGFKVSETWFYRFLEKAFAWLVLFQLGVLFLSTSVVIIEPSQQGLLERFGLPVKTRPVLNPGFHLKWPWPIDEVHRYPAHAIQTIYIGFVADPQMEKVRVVLWTRAHYKEEFNMLVASREQITETATNQVVGDQAVPVNLLTVSIPVQYRIRDLADWVYNNANSESVLEAIANREVVRYLVNVDIENIMTDGRSKATQDLRKHIQARADESRLGVEILYLGLQGIHPPVSVAADYEAVIGALQEKETNILAAEAYALETVPLARAEASNIINRAEIDRTNTVASAVAQSGRYLNQLEAFGASRTVFAQRTYLDTLARAVSNARKLVLSTTNTQDVILLNLEDKLRPDLEDIPLNPAKK